ncbi:hypothetical protein J6590_040822 [Homalodisca vitripennis]|nr:hypothetical protein J6590_040822 [Homalodisca vitripennis]
MISLSRLVLAVILCCYCLTILLPYLGFVLEPHQLPEGKCYQEFTECKNSYQCCGQLLCVSFVEIGVDLCYNWSTPDTSTTPTQRVSSSHQHEYSIFNNNVIL